jgi:chromosome transmission fidelity protein 1
VKDIEDIVVMGKKACVCPYYATRRAVKQSQVSQHRVGTQSTLSDVQLVTLPYNLLLQKNAREALDIDLTNQIVVIDEAHSTFSTSIFTYKLPAREIT